jgi:hypothetical protein
MLTNKSFLANLKNSFVIDSVPHISTGEVTGPGNSNGYLLHNMDSSSPISDYTSYSKSYHIMSELSYLTQQLGGSSYAREFAFQSDSSKLLDLSSSNCEELP